MKYTPELLSELGIELIIQIGATMAPIILIKTKNATLTHEITREHIEDIRWQTPLKLSDSEIVNNIVEGIVDNFLMTNPRYLRKIKLDKINETQNN